MRPFFAIIAPIRRLALAISCLWLTACPVVKPNPPCVHEGTNVTVKPYVALDAADEYYKRGVAYSAFEGCLELAVADFQRAIQRQERDQWRLLIRGDRTIDYFPHRELGIAYYYQGRLKSAEKELNTSLKYAHSDKAAVFLNLVQRAIVQFRQIEPSRPEIEISWETGSHWTNADPVVLSGTVQDKNYLADIKINGKSEYLVGNPVSHYFRRVLFLPNGRHEIPIEALNLMGTKARLVVEVHVDRQGPSIRIEKARPLVDGEDRPIEIEGVVEDAAGLAKLIVDGNRIETTNDSKQRFSTRISRNTHEFEILAVDTLGNKTRMTLPTDVGAPSANDTARLLASNANYPSVFLSKSGSDGVTVGFTDYLEEKAPGPIVVYQEHVPVPVEVLSNEVPIETVTVQVVQDCGDRIPATQPKPIMLGQELGMGSFRWTPSVTLAENANHIIIECLDANGERHSRQICFHRIIPEAFKGKVALTFAPAPDELISFVGKLKKELRGDDRFDTINFAKKDIYMKSTGRRVIELNELRVEVGPHGTTYIGTLMAPDGLEIGYPSLYLREFGVHETDARRLARLFKKHLRLEFPPLRGKVVKFDAGIVTSDIGYVLKLTGRHITVFRQNGGEQPHGKPKNIAQARIETNGLKDSSAKVIPKPNKDKVKNIVNENNEVITTYSDNL